MIFKISGAPVSFVNAIRRAIMTEVPCMAIEDVNILKNNSAFYDEVLALRLGLIPIRAAPEAYENKDNHKVAFILKGEGPATLYSRDLQSMDPEIVPAFPDIPTLKEVGIDWELGAWRGITVPKDTPDDVVNTLHTAIKTILDSKDWQDWMSEQGFGQLYLGPEDFDAFMAEDYEAAERLLKAGGLIS